MKTAFSALCGVFLLACAHGMPPLPVLPDTQEAKSCKRECMLLLNSCKSNVSYTTINGQLIPVRPRKCGNQYAECLETCPGAFYPENRPDGGAR